MSHPLVMLLISDLSGRMRGKSVPVRGSEKLLEEGLGWIPANAALTCFGPMAKVENDALGELRLIPAENEPVSFSHEKLEIEQNWCGSEKSCGWTDSPGNVACGASWNRH